MNETIDALQLNLGGGGLMIMNISLAVIMFGVALELKISHFKAIAKQPRGVITGFISQFLFLPAITLVLIWLLEPYPSFAGNDDGCGLSRRKYFKFFLPVSRR